MNRQEVYIVAAKRTPVGAFMGALSSKKAPELGSIAIQAALNEAGLRPEQVEETLMGNVLTAGVGQAPARQASLGAGIPQNVPCVTVNKVCGSGMQTVNMAAREIALGERDIIVAGGQESMSNAPFLADGMRQGLRLGNGKLVDSMIHDGLWDPYNDQHMGNCAELCAREKKFSREEQDELAIESFKRAQRATEQSLFKNEIAAIEIKGRKGDVTKVDQDEGPYKVKFEKVPQLKPVFDKDGTVTAANASSINDGAAALILASEKAVKENNLTPVAKVVAYAGHAQAPEWFTTAPVTALSSLLKKTNWKAEDVDSFEINEAFAVVSLAAQRDLGLDASKVNPWGGGISLGHPIGASGARILVTLLNYLKTNQKKKGAAGICIGGGEALATAVEMV
jgi:acetyl-CoA C-acetyltransferase